MTGHDLTTRPTTLPAKNDYAGMMAFAADLVTTGFLPAAVKTPAQAVAIILTGQELGLGPMQSLRSIYIVQGKPALSADLQLALFKKAGGKTEFQTLTAERAVLHLTHPNGDQHTETFTMADAVAARLAGKDTWKMFPKALLRSRAITAGLKSIGFEPTAGVYDPEELGVEVAELVVEEPSTARGADHSSGAKPAASGAAEAMDAPAPSSSGPTEIGKDGIPRYRSLGSPAPSGATKRARLNQKNVTALLTKAGSPEVLEAAVTRALDGVVVQPITDAKLWPVISADDYDRIVREIALDKMPEALDADNRSLETLLDDAKSSPAMRRKAISDKANLNLMPIGSLRVAVSAATKGREQDLHKIADDEELAAIMQAVENWK